jgi:hypothetical protein
MILILPNILSTRKQGRKFRKDRRSQTKKEEVRATK